jgi:hypothetical protein
MTAPHGICPVCDPRFPLIDATRWNWPWVSREWQPDIKVDASYDYCLVPSERPLYAILEDAVRHGVENPRHGAGCACMDQITYELHRHVNRALPPDDLVWREADPEDPSDYPQGGWLEETPDSREARFNAKMRIAHVLNMVIRRL